MRHNGQKGTSDRRYTQTLTDSETERPKRDLRQEVTLTDSETEQPKRDLSQTLHTDRTAKKRLQTESYTQTLTDSETEQPKRDLS